MLRRALSKPITTHLAALAVALVFLGAQVRRSAVWDPYELQTAELARRLAVHLFGATNLAIPSDPGTIPSLGDLSMGELPYTSMALSYRVFGWHDWSGRLALAAWAIAGAAALYVLLARTVHRRAGLYAVIVLATTPLYFMQARTMFGDAVTLAAYLVAVAGLGLAFVEGAWRTRAVALSVGGLGLLCGYLTRGLLVGVAAPLVAVGGAATLHASISVRRRRDLRGPFAVSMLAVGIGAAAQFFDTATPLAGLGSSGKRSIGMILADPTPRDSTFDRILRQLGHALYPWSALAPFAFGRLLAPPPAREGEPDDARDGEAFARLLLVSAAGVGLLATTAVAPLAGALPSIAVGGVAGAVGLAIFDFERGAAHSRALAIASALLAAVLFVDLKRDPGRALATFATENVVFPTTFVEQSSTWLKVVTVLMFVPVLLAFFDREGEPDPIARDGYERAAIYIERRWSRLKAVGAALADAWNGALVFVVVVLEAALVGLAAMLLIGSHAHWQSIDKLPRNLVTYGLNLWWQVPVVIASAAVGWTALSDAFAGLARLTGLHRGSMIAIAGVVGGAALSFGYYGALARQLSPREVYETFEGARGPGDQLALLALDARAASFYVDEPPPSFEQIHAAYGWLATPPPDATRFMVVRARDLAKLNSRWRADRRGNLPILDASSTQILLAASKLGGRPNQNPFEDMILSAMPSIQHPVSARLGDELDVLGWDITKDGYVQPTVVAGTPYQMHFYYRALKPVGGNWQGFVHIDREKTRLNADHAVLEGRYPMNLWQAGDIIRDTVTVTLAPTFSTGEYDVYFGFFNASSRMKVTEGPRSQDRVMGGTLSVR